MKFGKIKKYLHHYLDFGFSRFTLIFLLYPFFIFSFSPSFAQPPLDVKLAEQQVLHKSNASEPGTLDPHTATGVPSSNIQRDLFEGLVGEAPNGDIIPGAAESWDISNNGLTYTFVMRDDAHWSDGSPVTAHDFVFGIRRTVTPATASDYATTLAAINNAEAIIAGELQPESLGVKAIDDYTLEITLNGPTPYFLSLLTHSTTYPLHRSSFEEHGDKFTRPGNLVSNGAYSLQEWVVNSHIKLIRNTHYWNNKNTTINEVYYHAIEDMNSEVFRYRAGEIDFTYNEIPNTAIAWAKENIPNELHITPYLGIYYFGFNVTQPPFKDNKKLRQALSLAVDREIITDKILNDGVIPAYGFVPPGTLNYSTTSYEWEDWPREKRLAEAKRLYNEAGYSDENPLRIEYRYNTQENHKRVALAAANMWKKNLGVITTIVNQEWKVFLNVRIARRITEAFRDAWIGDYNDAYTFLELGLSPNDMNHSGYSNTRYDELLALSGQEYDTQKRFELLKEAEGLLLESYAIAPIYYFVNRRLAKPYVGGYVDNIMDHHYTKNFYLIDH